MQSERIFRSKLFSLIAVGCMMVLNSSHTSAQVVQPLEITAEPHYRLLLNNEHVRVFAVTVPAHEQAYVHHAYNFLMISPEDCEIVMWAEGQSAIQTVPLREGEVRFLFGGLARGLRNDSNQEFYAIIVEFLDPRVTTYGYHYYTGLWDYGGAIVPPPVDPYAAFVNTLPLGLADVKDVQLLPGDVLSRREQSANELLVAITPVQLTTDSGESINCGMGEVLWLGARDFGLLNSSFGPVPIENSIRTHLVCRWLGQSALDRRSSSRFSSWMNATILTPRCAETDRLEGGSISFQAACRS